MTDEHHLFLKECFRLAKISANNGESAVGAVIVKDGEILGEGTEQSRSRNDVTRHAEVVAILTAIERHGRDGCRGSTLYSNVEPCILCSYAIRHYGISRVVYAKRAGEVGGVHSHYPILKVGDIKRWGEPPEVIEISED
jgi:tRNA(adenine34) deaminase